MDELLVKLNYFDSWTKRRQELAEFYEDNLKDYVNIITDSAGMVSKFVISTDKKACLKTHLTLKEIQSKEVYNEPLCDLPQARRNCETFLSIPCDSYTTDSEAQIIVNAIRDFYETWI